MKNYFVVMITVILFLMSCTPSDKTYLRTSNDFFNNFDLVEVSDDYNSVTYKGTHNNMVLKVKKFDNVQQDKVDEYISEKMFFIFSLYREVHSPYPGLLSNKVECSSEFTPIEIKNTPHSYYIIQATDRLTYGACSQDLIKYNSILQFQYCENDGLYFIELFLPLDVDLERYESIVKQTLCPIA